MPKDTATHDETLTALVPATATDQPKGVLIGDQEYEVVQAVKVPILKHDSNQTVAVRIEQPIRHELSQKEIEVINKETGEVVKGTQETQIAVVRVTELGSGQLFNLVLNAISASEFERAYPENGYVGKCFGIRKLGLVSGKRYKDVQIVEIQPKGTTA